MTAVQKVKGKGYEETILYSQNVFLGILNTMRSNVKITNNLSSEGVLTIDPWFVVDDHLFSFKCNNIR